MKRSARDCTVRSGEQPRRLAPSRRSDRGARHGRVGSRTVAGAIVFLGLRSRAGVAPAPVRTGVETKLLRSVPHPSGVAQTVR